MRAMRRRRTKIIAAMTVLFMRRSRDDIFEGGARWFCAIFVFVPVYTTTPWKGWIGRQADSDRDERSGKYTNTRTILLQERERRTQDPLRVAQLHSAHEELLHRQGELLRILVDLQRALKEGQPAYSVEESQEHG